MSEGSKTEVAVGAAVLAIAAGFLIYAAQVTGLGPSGGAYELRAQFRSIEGVRAGTDVRIAGVKVGTVTSTSLDPQSFMAEARFTVREGVEIPEDSIVMISSEGLLGGNFVEISPGGSLEVLPPGAEVEDTQGSVGLISLLMKFVGGDKKEDGQ